MKSPSWPTRMARATQRAQRPTGVAHVRPSCSARWPEAGEIPRALVILQKRPRTSPELQLSANTISSSLKPSHLTLWLSWNSPAHTPGDPAHGGAVAGVGAQCRSSPRRRALSCRRCAWVGKDGGVK